MRDPKRISRILRDLRRAWEQSPDLRLGQLLCNVSLTKRFDHEFERNPFYYEDDDWERDFQYWIGMIESAKVLER